MLLNTCPVGSTLRGRTEQCSQNLKTKKNYCAVDYIFEHPSCKQAARDNFDRACATGNVLRFFIPGSGLHNLPVHVRNELASYICPLLIND